jgi:hypothetical protein
MLRLRATVTGPPGRYSHLAAVRDCGGGSVERAVHILGVERGRPGERSSCRHDRLRGWRRRFLGCQGRLQRLHGFRRFDLPPFGDFHSSYARFRGRNPYDHRNPGRFRDGEPDRNRRMTSRSSCDVDCCVDPLACLHVHARVAAMNASRSERDTRIALRVANSVVGASWANLANLGWCRPSNRAKFWEPQ